MTNEIKIGEITFVPDTHCVDADTGLDVWSFSPGLVREMLSAREQSNDGCGACGDGCRERGSCRVKDESPELPIADGWIEWKGGECPVHKDTVVQVKLRENSKGTSPACHYRWSKFNSYGDIVAYRVVQEGGAV